MYIVDTRSFKILETLYPETFTDIWKRIDELVNTGMLLSVKEVQREIEFKCREEHFFKWVKINKKIFKKPSIEEMKFVSQLFIEEKNRELVSLRNIRNGYPVADPFIIASAKINNATVISEEKYRIGAGKIPTICKKYNIKCIKIRDFYNIENL